MAEHKDYGLTGVNQTIQLGKQGPHLKSNGDGTFNVVDGSGLTLTAMGGSNATAATHFVTKAQMDNVVAGSNAGVLQLGDPEDGSWTDGAVQTLSTTTTVKESIDKINEALENVRNNTFVKSVDSTANVSSGGAPLSVQLTLSSIGNTTHYDVNWGDGNYSNNISASFITPDHTYTSNSGSPYDVTIIARNSSGTGEGSSATIVKEDFISIFTADPAADFALYGAASGGSAISNSDIGDTIYLDNNSTNTQGATVQYTVDWGDGNEETISADSSAGGADNTAARLSHQFSTTAETDEAFTVELSLDSHSTAAPGVIPATHTEVHKVYAEHTPTFTGASHSGINEDATSGFPITITNQTENTIGSYADFGIQYRYVWGDGQTTTVNTGTSASGDTGQTIQHTYELSSSDQANGVSQDYTGNLEVISEHDNSPFVSSNFTVHVEPDVRVYATASSTTSSLRASGDNERTVYKGTDLSGDNRAVITVDNTTQNADFYNIDWGDTTSSGQINETGAPAGSVAGANITHDYGSATTGNKSLVFAASGTPDITAQTSSTTITVKVEDVPSAPAGLSSKNITWSTNSNQGSSSKLASGAVDNTGSGFASGSTLNSNTLRRYDTTSSIQTSIASDVYNSFTGNEVSALVDGVAEGTKTFTNSTGETGSFSSLDITAEGDAHNEISTSTYPFNFYQVFSARVIKNISSMDHGMHTLALSHNNTGATNNVYFLYDNLSSTPTVSIGSATLEEDSAGSYRYVSGIPYYNSGSPSVKLVGATISNLTGQAYYDGTTIFHISGGSNYETQNSLSITEGTRSYADIDGASSMLNGSTPLANVGISTPYAIGNVSIPITTSNIKSVETIKFAAQNMNGISSYTSDHPTKIQVWKQSISANTIDEETIHVDNDLGFFYNDDAKRITEFSSAADTPAYSSTTDYFSNHAWTGAETIAGTSEAVVRFGQVEHNTVDYSDGYLPVGPDLNTGRSGTQYITYAFRRRTMSSFTLTLTGKVSGCFIAAPGTDIDDASTLNGWMDGGTTYGGAGTPGADTGNGGNGSNGCAFTSGDRVVDGTTYSNDDFTFTLGDQNATNSYSNQILVRFKLESGDYITGLNIA